MVLDKLAVKNSSEGIKKGLFTGDICQEIWIWTKIC